MEANQEVKEDLEDSNKLAGQLTLTTNVGQDILIAHVTCAAVIDGAMISDICERPLLN